MQRAAERLGKALRSADLQLPLMLRSAPRLCPETPAPLPVRTLS